MGFETFNPEVPPPEEKKKEEEEKELAFGSHFSPDTKSRMDTLREKGKDVPEYVQFGREVRGLLLQSVEKEGWPERPHAEQVEDLFEASDVAVASQWEESVQQFLNSHLEEWSKEARRLGHEEEAELLGNPELFEEKLRVRQFGALEPLREDMPGVWRSLLFLSSERQLAALSLSRRWVRELPENEAEDLGFQKKELELFSDLGAIFGKYADHAYVKQVELADAPGGSLETPLGSEEGSEYVYDLARGEEGQGPDMKSYAEVFSFEFPRIAKRLEALSSRVSRMVETGELPPSYVEFSSYLHEVGERYGSSETSPEKLSILWEELYARSTEVAEAGCPIMLVPQGAASVAGEAEKVDVEFRLGLRTERTRSIEEEATQFSRIAEEMSHQYEGSLKEPHEMPSLIITHQPFAFGPNLSWVTRGESGEGTLLSHANAVEDVTISQEVPFLKKVFGEDIVPPEKLSAHERAAVLDTSLHEIGHAVLPTEDALVHKRIGEGLHQDMLEELKAEATSARILLEGMRKGISVDAERQFFAKLGTLFDYVGSKTSDLESGGDYYYTGLVLLRELLRNGVLVREGEKYHVSEPEKGIEAFAKVSETICNLYAESSTKPSLVKKYARELIAECKKDKQVQELARMIRA